MDIDPNIDPFEKTCPNCQRDLSEWLKRLAKTDLGYPQYGHIACPCGTLLAVTFQWQVIACEVEVDQNAQARED